MARSKSILRRINGITFIVIEMTKEVPRPAQSAGKLISRDKVVALIGAGASGNSLAAAPLAQAGQVPLISPSSTNPAVTQAGDYIFRACFIDAFQGEAMARFAAQTLMAKKAAIMLDFIRRTARVAEFE